jgi:hypothetical protein
LQLFFHQGLARAGVLFFRFPGAAIQTKIEHLNTVLEEHADELAAGQFVVVAPGHIRVAGRPGSSVHEPGTKWLSSKTPAIRRKRGEESSLIGG